MQYRRERLMIPMVMATTVMVLAIGIVIYLVAVEGPAKDAEKVSVEKKLAEEQEKNRKLLEINEGYLKVCGDTAPDITRYLPVVSTDGVDDDTSMYRYYSRFLNDENLNGTGKKCSNVAEWIAAIKVKIDDMRKDHESAIKGKDRKYSKDVSNLNSKIDVLQREFTKAGNSVKRLVAELKTERENLETVEHSAKTDKKYLLEQKQELAKREGIERKAKLVALQKLDVINIRLEVALAEIERMRKEEKERVKGRKGYDRSVDGEIVSIKRSGEEALGSINIGSKDGLKKGVIFDVMRGNILKGYIQVYQVDERVSLFRIMKLEKDSDPIVEGDTVFSLLFTKGHKPEFVVIGSFKSSDFPYDSQDIKYRIIQWGGKVAEKITSNTKYVIIGDGELTKDQRRDISTYSVERISKAHLRDFLEKK